MRRSTAGIKEVADIKGLRDRAAIAIMAYTFARVSAVVGLARGDYRLEGKRARLRLLEKGSKEKLVWLHREAEELLDAYIAAPGIDEAGAPVFQMLDKAQRLTGKAVTRRDMLDVVKARCRAAGLSEAFCNHTFRGTGMTVFLATAARSKPHRRWLIMLIRAPRSSTTGARTWRPKEA